MADTSPSQVFERSFATRLERLAKLHQLRAPKHIICQGVIMLLRSAALAYGGMFWEQFAESVTPGLRVGMGFCGRCDRPHYSDTNCPACVAEELAEADAITGSTPEPPCQS